MSVDVVKLLRVHLANALGRVEHLTSLRAKQDAELVALRTEAAALRAQPCPGCVCADTEHRYCPVCADAIQDLRAERDALRRVLKEWGAWSDNDIDAALKEPK